MSNKSQATSAELDPVLAFEDDEDFEEDDDDRRDDEELLGLVEGAAPPPPPPQAARPPTAATAATSATGRNHLRPWMRGTSRAAAPFSFVKICSDQGVGSIRRRLRDAGS